MYACPVLQTITQVATRRARHIQRAALHAPPGHPAAIIRTPPVLPLPAAAAVSVAVAPPVPLALPRVPGPPERRRRAATPPHRTTSSVICHAAHSRPALPLSVPSVRLHVPWPCEYCHNVIMHACTHTYTRPPNNYTPPHAPAPHAYAHTPGLAREVRGTLPQQPRQATSRPPTGGPPGSSPSASSRPLQGWRRSSQGPPPSSAAAGCAPVAARMCRASRRRAVR